MDKSELQKTILARYDEIARRYAQAADRGEQADHTGGKSASVGREHGPVGGESGLGCAHLWSLVELFPGETLLDLGSGPGLETIALARLVDPARAYGLDALPSMVEVATENARGAGASNVRFLTAPMEAIPLEDASIDVVVSNCVINLSQDKEQVAGEIRRVLRPGGRLAIADMVWLGTPPPGVRNTAEAWACCLGGALEAAQYPGLLERAGFADIHLRILWTLRPGDMSCCHPAPGPESCCHPALGQESCCGPSAPAPTLASALITARKPGAPASSFHIREATPGDFDLALRLLRAARLPTAGVAEHLSSFLLACAPDGNVVGMAGLERYRSSALLRSLVVLPSWRGQGLGRRLVTSQLARLAPGTPVYLLTTNAEAYFRRLGFEAVPREEVRAEVTASAEFQGACPQSATILMRLAQ